MFNNENNSAFSPVLPTLQIAWDSTSIGELKTCPRKYQYSLLFGYSQHPESVHLTFGQIYHKALELYDHAKVSGADHEDALDAALDYALKATWDKELNRPWQSDHNFKNRFTLIRTIVWYLDEFQDDPVKTVILDNGKPAVELSFQFETDHLSVYTGERFILCGHLDRIGTFNDQTYILDRKTTGYTITPDFFRKFSPDNQFSTYMLAGQVVWSLPLSGLIVDAAQIAVTFSTFERGIVERKQEQIDEWYRDLGYWLQLAEHYAKINYWPQNDKSCGNYGGCPFRVICGQSPKVRPEWLEASFSKRVWNPLVARGDI